MEESPKITDPLYQGVSDAACVAGVAATGTLKVGNIVTPVVRPVNVQFGFFLRPNSAFGGDNTTAVFDYARGLPPPAGLSAMLFTKPDLIPDSLTHGTGLPEHHHGCQEHLRGSPALRRQVPGHLRTGPVRGPAHQLRCLNWTQRIKLKLINPLLGNNCYIGSDNNPIVVNPQLILGPGGGLTVRKPTRTRSSTRTPSSSTSPAR